MLKTIIQRLKQYGLIQCIVFAYGGLKLRLINRLLLGSYSQFKEDLILDKLLGKKEHGFYLDVGAYDPVWFSNTYRFYKRGWKGINIEPNLIQYNKFFKQRIRDINLNIGIGLKSSMAWYYVMDPSALSRFSKNDDEMNLTENCIQKKMLIKIHPLKKILFQYAKRKTIDFFSLDVEGMELDVLRSNDWNIYRPRFLCIETTSIMTKEKSKNNNKKINAYLSSKGYTLLFDNGLNSFYKAN